MLRVALECQVESNIMYFREQEHASTKLDTWARPRSAAIACRLQPPGILPSPDEHKVLHDDMLSKDLARYDMSRPTREELHDELCRTQGASPNAKFSHQCDGCQASAA